VLSVAVLAPGGTSGDALDNAFFVLGPEGSRGLVSQFAGTEASFFLPTGQRGWTIVDVGRPLPSPRPEIDDGIRHESRK
jgi:thiamine biosynthesis lipoprotein ApbE